MDQQSYRIAFHDVSPADANRYAEELREILHNASPDVSVERKREHPSTQDFGTTLILVLYSFRK